MCYYTAIFYPDVHQSFCNIRSNVVIFRLVVADPYHFNADPDPHKSNANHRPSRAVFKPPSPHCELPWLHFEPLNLLNFDLNLDLDPAFRPNADPDPASKINADPDSAFKMNAEPDSKP